MKHPSFSDRLSDLRRYPVLVLFTLFFAGLFVADLITPDRAFSPLENTTLAQRPSLSPDNLSAKSLNNYFTDYTRYVKEQVFFRDGWIDLQSLCETDFFRKTENGGILLGKDKMLFPRTYSLTKSEERTLPKNISALQSLSQRYPDKVTVLIAPEAATVYPENVPKNAPLLDCNRYLDEIASAVESAGGLFLDVRPTLIRHKDEYIYYRTDHHWTTEGAYYAYRQFCETLGLSPFVRESVPSHTVPDFYGTHYSKARNAHVRPDTITWYDLPNPLHIYTVSGNGETSADTETSLYATEQFEAHDKYAAFIHGNNGYSRIDGDGTGSILVVKDSYANSFVPFLTANYAQIDIIDFRNYNYGLDALTEKNHYDRILVLYSFDSFKSDPYLYRAGIVG